MKNLLLLLVACCLGFASSAQTTYQPNGTSSFTGGGTYCVGAAISPLTFTYTTCSNGTGASIGSPGEVWWYYNTTNSTNVATATLASGPISYTTATAPTGFLNYTPALSVGGDYYFFCVVRCTAGTVPCGGVVDTITSTSTQLVRVSPPPITPIATSINVCVTNSVNLSNAFSGGVWSSANSSVIDVSSTGVATGMSAGGAHITYTLGGCYVTRYVYAYDNPAPITPAGDPISTCEVTSVNLSNTTSGGTWYSSAPTTASVGSASGIVSTFTAGSATITYKITASGCYATKTVSVLANPAAIAGSTGVCTGGTTNLFSSPGGGTWSSSLPIRASVNATTGVVSGISGGTATITYKVSPSNCYITTSVNVSPPPAAITGPSTVCAGSTITMANAVAGGTWSSGAPLVATAGSNTGIVTGVSAATANISYVIPGCPAAVKNITVNALPGTLSGVFFTCYGQSTVLTSTVSGGTWTSSDTDVATVGSVGAASVAVTGVSMGVTSIKYSVSSGCSTTQIVTVYPLAPIVGSDTVCAGSEISLTDIVGGGTWVSSNPAIAEIDTFTGAVTGLVAGITYIEYALPTGCATNFYLRVIPALPPIAGPLVICSNSTAVLSNAVTGGAWSTSNEYVAEVDAASGSVSGHFPDTAMITYTKFGCITSSIVTINPLPTPTLSYNWATQKISTQSIYDAYQWYDTAVGAIPGATSYSLAVTNVSNTYYVVVTDGNGCSKATDPFVFPLFTGGPEAGVNYYGIHPNPATGVVYVDGAANGKVVVTSIEGRVMLSASHATRFDVSDLAKGIYFVRIYDEQDQLLKVEKLLKE